MKRLLIILIIIGVSVLTGFSQSRTADRLMPSAFSALDSPASNPPPIGSIRDCINCKRQNGPCEAAPVGYTPIRTDALKTPDGWMCSARAAGVGSGTLTNFSAGNLSPLFTTTETATTTTPALTFTLNTQAANTVFAGPTTGSAAVPTQRLLVVGDIPSLPASIITSGTISPTLIISGGISDTKCLRYAGGNIVLAAGDCSTGGSGGDALVANPLSQFASTTSEQLAVVLSNETGTGGGFARAGSPVFTGVITIPTPFTLGAVSVLPTGTELNFVDGVTSNIQTQLDSKLTPTGNGSGLTGLTKAQVGLSVVDNTSDATKNSATAVLSGKTISGAANTLTNVPAANISGVIPIANLATGTPDGTKFIRDDGTLAVPPGGSGGSGDVTAASNFGTDNMALRSDGTLKGSQSSSVVIGDDGSVTAGGSGGGNVYFPGGTSGGVTLGVQAVAGTHTIHLPTADGTNAQCVKTDGATNWFFGPCGGLADPGGNGFPARTALNTTINRTLTGTSGNVTIADGTGVAGNPTFDLGATAVQTDQTNTFGAFLQNFASSDLVVSRRAATPTTPLAGQIYQDTGDTLPYFCWDTGNCGELLVAGLSTINVGAGGNVTGDLAYANFVQASAASLLLGRGSASGAGDWQPITLGTGLTMTGTVLSAAGGGTIGGTTGATDNAILRADGAGGATIQSSGALVGDDGSITAGGSGGGRLDLPGSTSGVTTVGVAAAAGTYTFLLPPNDGDPNQFLQTNGSGVTIWATPAGAGDMLLATAQTVSALKTFDDLTFKIAGADYGASDESRPAVAIGTVIRNTNAGSKRWFVGIDDTVDFWGEILINGVSGPISMANGGLGVALTDPNADRILFWDDSAGAYAYLTLGTNLLITGTTLDASGGGGVTDGDKGDITVTASGATWTVDTGLSATKIGGGGVSTAEFDFIGTLASNAQTQLDGKQPLDSDLTTIAGLAATSDNFIVAVGSAWASRNVSNVRTTLSIQNVENTALSTWVGSANITTLGTVGTGTITTGAIIGDVTMNVTGTDATGDIYYRAASGILTRLPVGSAGQFVGVSGGLPAWATPAGGGDVTAAANFATDNVAIRADGTGKGVQLSSVIIGDDGSVTAGGSGGGGLAIPGLTSGLVTVNTADVAGTWTLTLPPDNGTASQFLQTDGNGVTIWATGAGGAPTDATYITQTAHASLSAEQALGALATGLLKNTTTTGVLSIAGASDLPSGIDAAKIGGGGVSTAEFDFLGTLTSDPQTQLDGKQPLDSDLTAIAASSSNGFYVKTGVGAAGIRTIVGTTNEITVSNGDGVSANPTLALSAIIDLSGKTSLAIPNAAAPTVDAFAEIAGDNNLWAASRGAPVFFDGTAAVALIGALVSDVPTNGQFPMWNTGGTITWETLGGSGTVTSVSVVTANGVSGSVATETTTPAITLTLGAITPTTVNGNTITTGTGTLTLAAGKTLTASNTLTFTGTDASSVAFGAGGTVAYTANLQQINMLNTTTLPDSSGNVFLEPYSIKATNDFWKQAHYIFNDTATDDALHGSFELPTGCASGSTITMVWTTTAITNTIRYTFSYRVITADDTNSLDQATSVEDVTITDTAPGATNRRMAAAFTPTNSNFATAGTVEWKLIRTGTTTDNLAAAVQLISLRFSCTP